MRGRAWRVVSGAAVLAAGWAAVGVWPQGMGAGAVRAAQVSQRPSPMNAPGTVGSLEPGPEGASQASPNIEAERQRLAIDERHKRMLQDTDRLLQLATELHSQVAATSKYETSAAAIKTADQIERLAKDVRERMKY